MTDVCRCGCSARISGCGDSTNRGTEILAPVGDTARDVRQLRGLAGEFGTSGLRSVTAGLDRHAGLVVPPWALAALRSAKSEDILCSVRPSGHMSPVTRATVSAVTASGGAKYLPPPSRGEIGVEWEVFEWHARGQVANAQGEVFRCICQGQSLFLACEARCHFLVKNPPKVHSQLWVRQHLTRYTFLFCPEFTEKRRTRERRVEAFRLDGDSTAANPDRHVIPERAGCKPTKDGRSRGWCAMMVLEQATLDLVPQASYDDMPKGFYRVENTTTQVYDPESRRYTGYGHHNDLGEGSLPLGLPVTGMESRYTASFFIEHCRDIDSGRITIVEQKPETPGGTPTPPDSPGGTPTPPDSPGGTPTPPGEDRPGGVATPRAPFAVTVATRRGE
jgi:hypothetical protein